jgi:DNA-binding PadR family transcriptional regulator
MQLLDRTNDASVQIKITDKELTILYEIGLNMIPTATDFVDFISNKYQVSQSGIWYTLKKLKKEGILDFTEKGEEQRPLGLTDMGMRILRSKVIDVENRQYHHVHAIQTSI